MDVQPSRRLRKKERTRALIQSAAMKLFRERGFDSVTIAEISEAADVDATTFWRHYKSKYALLYGDRDAWMESFRRNFDEAPADLSPLDAAIHGMAYTVSTVDPEFVELRADAMAQNPSPEIRAAIFSVEEALEQELTHGIAIRMGVEASRDPRPAVLANAIVASSRWMRDHRLKDAVRMPPPMRATALKDILRQVALVILAEAAN
jgi:AcrR family transcriptional regulator